MDPLVERHQLTLVELVVPVEVVEEPVDGLAVIVGRAVRGEARGRALEHGAHVCETREVLDLDGRHEHAAARIDLDQPLLREPA